MAQDTQSAVDVWQTGTGLVDDVDGYISEPYFGVDERYNAEAVLFAATLIDASGEPITNLRFSVGEGWEVNDAGTEISHPNRAQINNNSRFGRFIDRLARPTTERAPKNRQVISPAGKENGLGLVDTLRAKGTPFQAKTFEGLGFHWQLHKMETMGKDENNQPIIKDVLFPVKYIGEYGKSKGAGVPAAAPANRSVQAPQQAAAVPAAPAVASSANGEFPVALRKRLTLAALEQDLKTFLRNAGRDKEVLQLPDDVMGNILDGSSEGFHAQVNG